VVRQVRSRSSLWTLQHRNRASPREPKHHHIGSRIHREAATRRLAQMMEKFHYEFEDGKKVTLPKFDSVMTVGFARKNRQTEQAEIGWMLLEKAADEKALDVIDEQALSSFEAFMEAWQKDSGVSVGESTRSSN